MNRGWKLLLLSIVILVTSTTTSGYAMMWQPYQFPAQNQEYKYKIVWFEDGIAKTSMYELVIEESENEQMEVSVKTTWMVNQEELDQQVLGGWWGGGAFGLTMAFINPMYAAFFGGLDLKVGNKMSFFGAGVVEVIGTESVAGRTGFVCRLLNEDGGTVLGRYVVDPAVPLPLKTELFEEDGSKQFETELQHLEF